MNNKSCCGNGTKLIYSCSGASDVGKIADEVARKLSKTKQGAMTCLAAIGAQLSGFVESAKGASENITIDGCNVACARKTLEHIGVKPKSYIITEMGYKKGETSVTDKVIDEVVNKISLGRSVQTKETGQQNGCCC
jgi:uncharacterized metal-binding protein